MVLRVIALTAALLLAYLPVYSCAQQAAKAKHVLLLNSYHQRMTWVGNILQAVEDELVKDDSNLVLHVENMDTKRFHSKDYIDSLFDSYRAKYSNTRFDLILSSDNNAFDFLKQHRDTLFPGIPVIFCGVNDYTPEMLEGFPNVTGVAEVISPAKTMDVILRNHPDVREVFIINDYLKTGRAWESSIRKQLSRYEGRVRFRYAENITIEQLRKTIKRLPGNTVVLLGVYFSDSEGQYITYEDIGEILTRNSPIPVYCLLRFNLLADVIGGHLINGYAQGQAMSRIASRVLTGEQAGSIPVMTKGANTYIFDYNALERYGIALSDLPPDSKIINRPSSLFQKHKPLILSTTTAFVLLVILSTLLTISSLNQRKLARKLAESRRKFKAVFRQTTHFMALTDTAGETLQSNRQVERLSNGPPVQGMFFWESPWFQGLESEQRRLRDAIKQAVRGETIHIEVRHHDPEKGKRIISCTVSPAKNEIGEVEFVILEGHDITELKEAEYALAENFRFVEALLSATPSPVFYKDQHGRYLGCNKAFEEFFNKTCESIKGKTVEEVWPENHAHTFENKDKELIGKGEGVQSYSHEIKDGSGRLRTILLRKSVFFDSRGRAAGVIGAFVDITEIKESEDRIRKVHNYLQAILDSMPSAVISVDLKGRVVLHNRSASNHCDACLSNARGQLFTSVLPWLENEQDKILAAIHERRPLDGLRCQFKKGNARLYAFVSVFPLSGVDKEGAVIRVDDITERERLEQAIIQSEKMLSVGGLAAGMAHEINNPLGGILQGIQNIFRRTSSDLPANQKVAEEIGCSLDHIMRYLKERRIIAMLEGIQNSGERAAHIVSNMLEFTSPSKERLTTATITDIIDKALELAKSDYNLKSSLGFHSIAVEKEYAEDMPAMVCSPSELEQVFLNLLKNAAAAVRENESERPPAITLRAYTDKDHIIAEVEDSGPGIDKKHISRVFDPFFTTRPPGQGTGLGLAVSYFIISRNHGGHISVKSPPGAGATFSIHLPISPSTAQSKQLEAT